MAIKRMPQVQFDGAWYSLRSRTVQVPDFAAMPQFEVLQWLCQHTYARGYQRAANPLRGYAGSVSRVAS